MRHSRAWVRGVTLIELMIVLVIIAILASIAVPSYQAYSRRTYRAAARACISETAQFLERYMTTNMTYDGFADPAMTCETESNLDDRYTITVEVDGRTFLITATPRNAQVHDTQCGTLTYDETGTRTESGSGTVDECW